ncbi:MAG: hypothetical protein K1Y02_25415 [Candidatus Hydrogenedentes bacterium]|nr:hypothetical protein [Candidatus Hydrogenedentota bacterium]
MMQQWIAANVKWVVPVLLILLKIGLKTLVASPFKGLEMWKAILQLPVDVGFLSISFLGAALLLNPDRGPVLYPTILLFLVLMLVSVLLWKLSPTDVGKKPVFTALGLACLNALLTGWMLAAGLALM